MVQNVAVIFIHGMGKDEKGYSKELQTAVLDKLAEDNPELNGFVDFEEVNWGKIFQDDQDMFIALSQKRGLRDLLALRTFLVNFLADTIAYQILPPKANSDGNRNGYSAVHLRIADALKTLAQAERLGPDAKLIVVAHSLGTLIASNFFYDMQNHGQMDENGQARSLLYGELLERFTNPATSALELGKTFSYFFTLGSPLALYSLRYTNYGTPVRVPAAAPVNNATHWVNFYDVDDIIAYPLDDKGNYKNCVTDKEIWAGNILTGNTPLVHNGYWNNAEVVTELYKKICKLANE